MQAIVHSGTDVSHAPFQGNAMQIFSSFDAQLRGATPPVPDSPELNVGLQLCVIPATAGLGHGCDHVFLRAGDMQSGIVSARPGWWACLRGGLRVLAAGQELAALAGGDVFMPQPGQPVTLQAVLDSVLVHAVPQPGSEDRPGTPSFVVIEPGEPDWAQRLRAHGTVWGACYRGTLCLQWRTTRGAAGVRTVYLQPGMAFAPGRYDDYCLDAMVPDAGLLCCARSPVDDTGPARVLARAA